jgi:uncharacterized protein YeaO (DUF488 family)
MSVDDIKIKRIYEPATVEDGYRILVDRLWPRGVSRDAAKLDLWLREVAPSTELRQWFNHDPEKWEAFVTRYRAELDNNQESIDVLMCVTQRQTTTLLYSARDTEHNQAVVLQPYLRDLQDRQDGWNNQSLSE